jgi:TolB-like protein
MQCLNEDNRSRLESLRRADPFVDQALHQLARILGSQAFARLHQQAKDFLTFVVGHSLLGQADHIKETTIAVFVYGEPADFNSAESSRIRVAGFDLRRRLRKYYEQEGVRDRIHIALPVKGFAPKIRDRQITVAIVLENWSPGDRHGHLATGISNEIIDRLNESGWIRARPANTSASQTSSEFVVRGSLESGATNLRVNMSVGEIATGRILWSEHFQDERERAFVLARRVADALIRTFLHHQESFAARTAGRAPARTPPRQRKRLRHVS